MTDGFAVPADRSSEADLEKEALASRQDLRAAANAIEAARQSVQVAVAQYYPSVSLNVSGFLYREFYGDASKWNAVLSANLPIFSAGIIEAARARGPLGAWTSSTSNPGLTNMWSMRSTGKRDGNVGGAAVDKLIYRIDLTGARRRLRYEGHAA